MITWKTIFHNFKIILKFLKPVLKVLLVLFLFIIIGLIIFTYLIDRSIDPEETYFLVVKLTKLFFTVLTVAVIVFLIVILIKFFYKISIFAGKNKYSKIISISIVSLVFFKSLRTLIVIPFYIILLNGINELSYSSKTFNGSTFAEINSTYQHGHTVGYQEAYDDAYEEAFSSYKNVDNSNWNRWFYFKEVAKLVVNKFNLWFTDTMILLFTIFKGFFYNYSYLRNSILGLGLLFLFGSISDFFLDPKSKDRIKRNFGSIGIWLKKYKVNILFVIIFILSAFLCFSSIIAIPIIQDGKNLDGVTAEDFEKELEKLYVNNSKLDSAIIILNLDTRKAEKNVQQYIKNYNPDSIILNENASVNSIYLSRYSTTKQQLINMIQSYKLSNSEWQKLVNEYDNKLKDEKDFLNSNYKNFSKMPAAGNERDLFYSECLNYFSFTIENYKRIMNTNHSLLLKYEESYDAFIYNLFQNFDRNINKVATFEIANGLDDFRNSYGIESIYIDTEPINFIKFDSQNYTKPIMGSDKPISGIFGWISNWLIKTRSNEMALIVGMIGFGLLGAGISTLLKNKKAPDEMLIFKDNITATLLGGFSAALIIFLTVKGGIMIFTTADVEPNQYSLFFLCMVGAVFSEQVWKKAQKQLSK